MRSEQYKFARLFREVLSGPDWVDCRTRGALDVAAAARRRWAVQGLPVSQELTYVINADGGAPRRDFLLVWLDFSTLRLRFAADFRGSVTVDETDGAVEAFRRALRVLSDVPEHLGPATAGSWLDRVHEQVPLYVTSGRGDFEPWDAGRNDRDGPWWGSAAATLRAELYRWQFQPVLGRVRELLSQAGWEGLSGDAGCGLDCWFDNGRVVIEMDLGQERGDFAPRLRVSVPAADGRSHTTTRFRLPQDTVTDVDSLLRLLLDWQHRLGPYQLGWFIAELAATAPGSELFRDGRWFTLSAPPPPPSLGMVGTRTRERVADMVRLLRAAGWGDCPPSRSPLLTAVAAVEAPKGAEVSWRCEYVVTGYSALPEALRLSVAEPDTNRTVLQSDMPDLAGQFSEIFGGTVDFLVDLVGVDEPVWAVRDHGPRERLAQVLDRLTAGGSVLRVSGRIGLVAGLVAVKEEGLSGLLLTPVAKGTLPLGDARSLAAVTAELASRADRSADLGELWLEAGFAAVTAVRAHLAVTAFERAAQSGVGTRLARMWLGALLFFADPDAALTALVQATRSGPVPTVIWHLRAELLMLAGDPEGALAVLAEATGQQPEEPELWARYGFHLAQADRVVGAISALDEAVATGDNAESRWYRGYAHMLAGDRGAALDDLETAVRLDGTLAEQIHSDPDLAPLRLEPRFEALAQIPAVRRANVWNGLRGPLSTDGWCEDQEGNLLRVDDEFDDDVDVAIFTITPVDEHDAITLNVDDGVSGLLFFRVDLGGDPEPLTDLLTRWPAEFTSENIDGRVDVPALVDALCVGYPGKVSRLAGRAVGWELLHRSGA